MRARLLSRASICGLSLLTTSLFTACDPSPQPQIDSPQPQIDSPPPPPPPPPASPETQGWQYVLIEDLSTGVSGDAPGADIDAVSVITPDGVEHFATQIHDSNIGVHGNAFRDTNAALGAPDSNCTKRSFTALGGEESGGYLVLGFATPAFDLYFGEGSRIHIYELGPTYCPNQPTWDDDPYAVSVGLGDRREDFGGEPIGQAGPGINIIPVVESAPLSTPADG